jgi:hypothetical protein
MLKEVKLLEESQGLDGAAGGAAHAAGGSAVSIKFCP